MKKILSGAIALLLATTAANAADLYQPQPVLDNVPEVEIQQSSSGWYLRGDVGYSFNKLRGARYYQGGFSGNEVDFASSRIDDSFVLGGGVGYQFNNHLRGDVTFDHLTKTDFRGSTIGVCTGGVVCSSSDAAAFRAYSLMANIYVDLGTYAYFTPYVGAGFGASYVKWDRLRNTICDDPGVAGCFTTEHGGKGKWRATAALMAGASVDITCNLKADVGYRFRYVDGGNMFGYADNGGPGRDKGFYSHEARVGARYAFGGCEQAQVMEPAEVPMQPPVYK
ncbi:outer membrane protein [Neorhizobium sp. NPDC001467]|uniref:outer membrane protein n=1 Tax=Neorhizobium sp. NPDC001467 TaxID=3390595 RepID=UPI003D06F767